MPQRSARLQYALLALVAFLAFTHVYRGASNVRQNLSRGQFLSRRPFSESYFGPLAASVTPEAVAAGLRNGDTVLAINGRPFTGTSVLLDEVNSSRPGQPLTITYRREHAAPATATVILRAQRDAPASYVEWFIRSALFLSAVLCLLAGIYVVLARPRSLDAWLILGILAYFDPLFINSSQMYTHGRLLTQIWGDTAQTAMPLCLMAFGIYFPDRSSIDVRFPWIKWCIAIPILLLYPTDILYYYGHGFNFAADAWISPWFYRITVAENLLSALAISYFFANLAHKLSQSTGDARRRLRIMYYGSIAGLTPFFILLIISLIRKTDLGQGIHHWVLVAVLADLLLFPLSLAYVVIVHRALDLRILVRQGTKYFFARQSILVVGIALAIWMTYEINLAIANHGHRGLSDVARLFAIVAIFVAYRRVGAKRMQAAIDQRFFREAYSSDLVLSELSEEVRNFTEIAPLIDNISSRIGSTLHIDRIAVFLRVGETFQLAHATGAAAFPGTILSLPASSTTITTLTRSKGPANVYRDDPGSWLVDATDAERTALADLSTELLVPLPGRGRLIGVMALGPKRSEEPYSRMDRQLLQTVASQTGLALENAELLENLSIEISQRERVSREIEIAVEVQQRLFPQSYPHVEGIDLAGYCRPAHAVGGDYYDFFLLPTTGQPDGSLPRLAIAIGDISGKGISAALLMASLRASLRSTAGLQAESGSHDLTTLMRSVNRLVYDSSTDSRYATFFYAEYDPASRLLTYVNAGHNPPVVLRGTNAIQLEATGIVIGLMPEAEYEQSTLPLNSGDVLLAFTDGISEAMTYADEEWGEDRMFACAKTFLAHPDCAHTAQPLLDCILKAADTFTAGAPQHDDMTLLVCTIQ